jgi:hypothetical protein
MASGGSGPEKKMHLLQVKIKAIASFIQYHVTPAL